MNITELKQLLRIQEDDTEQDGYLEAILPVVKDHARCYCNQDFRTEEGEDDFPGGVRLGIAKFIEVQMNRPAGVQSYTLARESTTWASGSSGLPEEVENLWSPHRVVHFI
jgi:hypothetical protein